MRKIPKGKYIWLAAAGTAVLLLAAGVYAFNISRLNQPEAAYWHALETGLDSAAVTCSMHKTDQGVTTKHTAVLDLLSKSNLRANTTLTKDGSTVSTETIVTKTDQYVRYTSIAKASDKSKDFSKVLNVWSKLPRTDTDAVPLYDKTVLGGCIVPLADLTKEQRELSMKTIKKNNIFKTDFKKADFQFDPFAPSIKYDVTIPANIYVLYMQNLGFSLGLTGLDELDSTPYMKKDAPPAKLQFVVDARTQQLKRIVLMESDTTFNFSGYGTLPDTAPPKSSVTAAELEKRLKSIQ